MTNSRYFSFSVFFVILVSCCLVLFRPVNADAAVAIVDYDDSYTNKRAAIYTEGYDYYFILDSTPEQGKKLVMSTAPFVVTCDGVQDVSGAYTVELSSPGGNVYVRHFARGQFQAYNNEYDNCGSEVVLRFKYSGQDYKTNIDFSASNGLEFKRSGDIISGVMYSMINYLKSQDVLLEQYPYYIFGYNPKCDRFCLWLSKTDFNNASETSTDVGFVGCTFSVEEMKTENFFSSPDKPYLWNNFGGSIDKNFVKSVNYLSPNDMYLHVPLYSNATAIYDAAGNYIKVPHNPYPSYEIFAGISSLTPTPTPIPTPKPVPEYTFTYDALAVGVDVKGYAKNQYPNGNGVDTIYIDSKSDFKSVYNSGASHPDSFGLLISDAKPKVYVDYIVEIAYPSVSYVNHILKSKEGAEMLDGIGIVEGSEKYMLARDVYTNWLSSLGKGNAEYYTVSGRYYYITYTAFKNRGAFEFSPDDALTARFASKQALKDYYHLTDKEWDAVGKYIVLFATPVSCTVRLGYRSSAYGYIYGDTTTTVFSTDGTGKVLVQSVVSGDVITDTDIQRENDYILKKYAMETGNIIGSVSDISGAFENLGTSNIWATFKNATTGLMTMASSVSHITIAIGAVFSFLPSGVYNLMYLTLMIVLVCAIIKAIRG